MAELKCRVRSRIWIRKRFERSHSDKTIYYRFRILLPELDKIHLLHMMIIDR
jgi:hypothetical protein